MKYEFMRNAFMAIVLITPLFGIMGTMIVGKKMAFFSDALGHSALTGIAIGMLAGIKDTTISMVIFAILFALLLNNISRKAFSSNDTIISVFSSASMALGLVVLSRGGNFSKYSALLVGDVLSITKQEILYLAIAFSVTVVYWLVASNKMVAISLNPTLARGRGFSVRLLEDVFAVLVALVVMLSIKWVGILIINALLILPAAASGNISENLREYHFFSVLFSVFSGLVGLWISYHTNAATGPMIVIIAAVIYFGTYIYGKKRK